MYFGQQRSKISDSMRGAYLGPEFSDLEAVKMLKRFHPHFRSFNEFSELCRLVAGYINEGKVVGWFQGRMEWGPRALGNRSILADPRNPEIQKRMNLKIKFRESFRPFAPAVLAEAASRYFDLSQKSPYMLLVVSLIEQYRHPLPENYYRLPLKQKLYFLRSDLPAITHLDYSARIQTVDQQANPRFHELISAFQESTGCPMLVNTSFNVRGEPIVCTPEQAYRCFMRTGIDCLVIGNLLFLKQEQPVWQGSSTWEQDLILD